MSGSAKQANERIAQDGVTQVSDMSGLVGIDAGVFDQNLPGHVRRTFVGVIGDDDGSATGQRIAAWSRTRRALMYPAPATSNFSNPSGSGISATISSAILRGALRSCLASSNGNGMANSPISTLGGWSMAMFGRSIWYFRRRNSRT